MVFHRFKSNLRKGIKSDIYLVKALLKYPNDIQLLIKLIILRVLWNKSK